MGGLLREHSDELSVRAQRDILDLPELSFSIFFIRQHVRAALLLNLVDTLVVIGGEQDYGRSLVNNKLKV